MFESRGTPPAARIVTRPDGFTLLEVMVSLAILSISLVAILNLHSGAVRTHNHAKFLTVATLLARSKMVDIEERIYAEDLSDFDEALSGNFADEGYEGFTWEAELVKPELSLDVGTLEGMVGQLLGLDEEALAGGGVGGGDSAGGGLLASLGGGVENLVASQLTSLETTIEEGVREVRLTVRWEDITGPSELTVVTHVVKVPGRGAPGGQADLQQSQAVKALENARKRLGNLPNMPAMRSPTLGIPAIRPPLNTKLGRR